MSYKCPAGCGKKFLTSLHAMQHSNIAHPEAKVGEVKRKGWVTPHGFVDMKEPVTYEEACEAAKSVCEALSARKSPDGYPTVHLDPWERDRLDKNGEISWDKGQAFWCGRKVIINRVIEEEKP